MKRLMYVIITALLVFSLAACGKNDEVTKQSPDNEGIVASDTDNQDTENNAGSSDGNPFSDNSIDSSSDWNPFADNSSSVDSFFETKENELAEAKRANPLWKGLYMSQNSGYDDNFGYVEIDVTDDGMLDVNYNLSGEQGSFLMEQKEFTESDSRDWNGKAYKEVKGSAELRYDNVYVNLYIDSEYSGERYQINLYACTDEREELVNVYSYLKCIFEDDHDKPDGYTDADEYGLITEALKDNSGYFTPASDDYAICARDSQVEIYDRKTWEVLEKYPIIQYSLYDFDKNGVKIKTTVKEAYESAESAKAVFDYRVESGYENYFLNGNCIYYEDEYNNRSATIADLDYGYKWYYDCHYIYAYRLYDGERDSENHEYVYRSRPFTKHEYREYNCMTEGIAKTIALWEAGYYSCKDEGCDDRIWYNGFVPDALNLDILSYHNDIIRMYDDHAYTLSYGSYNYINPETDMYEYFDYAAIFTKIEYNETEVTVTKYVFDVPSGDYSTLEATIDNFESLTPTMLEKHTYDMTKKADE